MANGKYETIEDMINKRQSSKGKAKLKFYQIIGTYYDEMKTRRQSGDFQFEEDTFSKSAQTFIEIHHEALLSTKFQETKPQVNDMNSNYYDLYYTNFKNRIETKVVNDDEYENDYINFIDFITPNHCIKRKVDNERLK